MQRGSLLRGLPCAAHLNLLTFLSCQSVDRCCDCTFDSSTGFICYSQKLRSSAFGAVIFSCERGVALKSKDDQCSGPL